MHIFYLKCLWEGFKTLHFAHKIGESGLAGVERKNIFEYLLFKIHFEGIKTPRFANKLVESKFSGVGRNNIVENVLFEMAFGKA